MSERKTAEVVEKNTTIPKKRLVLLVDGTGANATSADTSIKSLTNIGKLNRYLIKSQDSRSGMPQYTIYIPGIGMDENKGLIKNTYEKMTGSSIPSREIAHAYRALIKEYNLGDEVSLMGFSRASLFIISIQLIRHKHQFQGEYIARMVASLIGQIGILRENDLEKIDEIVDQ
ncbi:hypothetical protein BDQ17DRAFT_1548688 [Cyathus striatus]|nr:hypothetical protein BDQ17DRAFT_1548688 [Cyathus striatus]